MHNYVLCSDGAGGEHGGDPYLRRVAYGYTLVHAVTLDVAYCGMGTLSGRQSVPRAEIAGLAVGLDDVEHIRLGDLGIVVDCYTDHLNIIKWLHRASDNFWPDTRMRGNHDVYEMLHDALHFRDRHRVF